MSIRRRLQALEKAAGPTEPNPLDGLTIMELGSITDFWEHWHKDWPNLKGPLQMYLSLSERARQALAVACPEPFAELTIKDAHELIEFFRHLERLPPEERALAEAKLAEMAAPGTED